MSSTIDWQTIEDPRWANPLEHHVLIPWETAEAAIEWCGTHIPDDDWRCAWRVPPGQPMQYQFSFSKTCDSVRFKLTWL
jgi:hypothetical protein